MASAKFNVLFTGELIGDANPSTVRRQLQQQFALTDEAAERLLSGQTFVVRRGVDIETANRYQEAFRNANALVQIRPVETRVETPRLSGEGLVDASDDVAQKEPFGTTSNGPHQLTQVEESESQGQQGVADAPEIDTSHLSLVPGHDWTLEDCQPAPVPAKLPDISHLELVAITSDSGEKGDY